MADIISGKSRFNGDKNAPIRRVVQNSDREFSIDYEEEALTEEEIHRRVVAHKRKNITIIAGVTLGAIILILIIRFIVGNIKYSGYTILDSASREDANIAEYVNFEDGYVRYSNDGAAYYTTNNVAQWNQTFSMKKAQAKVCKNMVVVGDIGGNLVYVFDKKGSISNFTTSLSMSQVEVGSTGLVATVLEDNDANYINMYDKQGEKVYSVKTTLAGDGYPLDIAISDDGKKLIASFVYVSGESIKTHVVFYNFSEVGQNVTERVVGGFDHYNDTLVGDVAFVSDTSAIAIGENVISIYKIKEYPNLEKEITIEDEIENVFFNQNYIGVIVNSSGTPEPYKLLVYNMSGSKQCEKLLDTKYTEAKFNDKYIILNNFKDMKLFNINGKEMGNIQFEFSADRVLPLDSKDKYILVNSTYVQMIKLN